jgi:hypothetical protein
MRMMLLISLIIAIIASINGQWETIKQQQRILPMFRDDLPVGNTNQFQLQTTFRIPFPQCLTTETASALFNPSTLQNLFQIKIQDEERKLKQERTRNDDLNNSMKNMIHFLE